MAAHGGEIVIEKAQPVGAVPLKAVGAPSYEANQQSVRSSPGTDRARRGPTS
jgi:hypothetical protein